MDGGVSNMKKKKFQNYSIWVLLAIFVMYILYDLFNFSNFLMIPVNNLNTDLFAIVTNAFVALLVFFISYNEIDMRTLKKDENAKHLSSILLIDTYNECLSTLELLENRSVVETYIVPKIDFNKTKKENSIITNFQSLPFDTFEKIMSLAEKGYISKEDINLYLEVKKEFSFIVYMKIVFFDLNSAETDRQIKFCNEITKRYDLLISKIKNELKKKL